jgi:hypothetical protein
MMSAVNCLFIFVIRVIHYSGNFVSHDFSAGSVSFGVFSLTIDLLLTVYSLILLGYRVGSNLYYLYKYETIIRRSYYYSLPSPSSSSVSVSKSVSPSSKFNCFISARKPYLVGFRVKIQYIISIH